MMKHRAYISLGSNVDREANLREALLALSRSAEILSVSPVYESIDAKNQTQNQYLNMAVLAQTELTAEQLKSDVLQEIESHLGRNRSNPAEVPIDLDLSLFDDLQLSTERLRIPDPDILKYLFVARPLADIAPDYLHPLRHETLQQIAGKLSGHEDLRLRQDLNMMLHPLTISAKLLNAETSTYLDSLVNLSISSKSPMFAETQTEQLRSVIQECTVHSNFDHFEDLVETVARSIIDESGLEHVHIVARIAASSTGAILLEIDRTLSDYL